MNEREMLEFLVASGEADNEERLSDWLEDACRRLLVGVMVWSATTPDEAAEDRERDRRLWGESITGMLAVGHLFGTMSGEDSPTVFAYSWLHRVLDYWDRFFMAVMGNITAGVAPLDEIPESLHEVAQGHMAYQSSDECHNRNAALLRHHRDILAALERQVEKDAQGTLTA